jgi:hypothetical protein
MPPVVLPQRRFDLGTPGLVLTRFDQVHEVEDLSEAERQKQEQEQEKMLRAGKTNVQPGNTNVAGRKTMAGWKTPGDGPRKTTLGAPMSQEGAHNAVLLTEEEGNITEEEAVVTNPQDDDLEEDDLEEDDLGGPPYGHHLASSKARSQARSQARSKASHSISTKDSEGLHRASQPAPTSNQSYQTVTSSLSTMSASDPFSMLEIQRLVFLREFNSR